jgi:hypothetical protein
MFALKHAELNPNNPESSSHLNAFQSISDDFNIPLIPSQYSQFQTKRIKKSFKKL